MTNPFSRTFVTGYSYNSRAPVHPSAIVGKYAKTSRTLILSLTQEGKSKSKLRVFQPLGFLPCENDPADHRDVREDRNHPEHGGHAIEQRADDDQHHSLRSLEEAHLAFRNNVLGARARVTYHHRAGHHDRG